MTIYRASSLVSDELLLGCFTMSTVSTNAKLFSQFIFLLILVLVASMNTSADLGDLSRSLLGSSDSDLMLCEKLFRHLYTSSTGFLD